MILSGTVLAGWVTGLITGITPEGVRWIRGRRSDNATADFSRAQTIATLGRRIDAAEDLLAKYRKEQEEDRAEREKDRIEQQRITGLFHEALGMLRDFIDSASAHQWQVPQMSRELSRELENRGRP